jgi:organic radical activating enzyme
MHTIVDEDQDDPRVFIPNIEFYITNVCNLNCTNCNRFNDYNFSGHQLWKDYEADYTEWAKHVRLQRITILGGEPLLNPSLLEWIDGINRLWGKRVTVLTNATRLTRVPGLYDRLLTQADKKHHWIRNQVSVSLHNPNDKEHCFDEIKRFLKGNVRIYHRDDPENVDNCLTMGGAYALVDENNVSIAVWEYDDFYNAAIYRNEAGNLTLYNNDPEQAHKDCGFARYKSYHFIRGKLYKCGPVALFPEFDRQHRLDVSESDRELINSYHALSPYEFDVRGKKFISQIDNVISQCKFCPVEWSMTRLHAVVKKPGATSGFIK